MEGIRLPYPISANRYWRRYGYRVVKSAEAIKYTNDVRQICATEGVKKIEGDVALEVLFHPKLTKKGKPSATRLDLSNTIKVVEDALNGIAWTDDKQVVRLYAGIADPVVSGGITIRWSEA